MRAIGFGTPSHKMLSMASDVPMTVHQLRRLAEEKYGEIEIDRSRLSECARRHKAIGLLKITGHVGRWGSPSPLYVITEKGRDMLAAMSHRNLEEK